MLINELFKIGFKVKLYVFGKILFLVFINLIIGI